MKLIVLRVALGRVWGSDTRAPAASTMQFAKHSDRAAMDVNRDLESVQYTYTSMK